MDGRRREATGEGQVWRVFSSSLWLCDCLSCTSVIRGVLGGNSMGLILEARNVHSHSQHFSDLRVGVVETSYCVSGRTGQIHTARGFT
jgi:hypothetical protein